MRDGPSGRSPRVTKNKNSPGMTKNKKHCHSECNEESSFINKADLFDWILRFAQDDGEKEKRVTCTAGGARFVRCLVTRGAPAFFVKGIKALSFSGLPRESIKKQAGCWLWDGLPDQSPAMTRKRTARRRIKNNKSGKDNKKQSAGGGKKRK